MGLRELLGEARERTLSLLASLSDEDLSRQHSPLQSPLVWDLAHIASFEEQWLCGGQLRDEYDAIRHPRRLRDRLPLLTPGEAQAYAAAVRERALGGLDGADPSILRMVIQHEHQHCETMLQTIRLARLPYMRPPAPPRVEGEAYVEAGPFTMGTADREWAYDNERPAHEVDLPAFFVDRYPVTNAELGTAGPPDAPACHVSWHEAVAYAKGVGKRLPSETEWEKAAKLGVLAGVGYVWEWTASEFRGYDGFAAHPYREYSEPFFGDEYRVMRGASFATHPCIARVTFRNWDYPVRSQIFAGFRLARDPRGGDGPEGPSPVSC